jgi:predicted Zn-dependent peptidase
MIQNIKSPTELSGFYIVFNGSVQNEKPGIRGISHLMEHLIYKGNEKLYNIFSGLAVNGNAFTSSNIVVFHITGLDQFIDKYKYSFLKNLSKFNITEKQFQNEKNIVIQEYFDFFNEQSYRHHDNLLRKYLNFYGAIGSLNDLKNLKLEDCYDYFDKFFKNPTQIINISKNHPFEESINFEDKKQYPNPVLSEYKNVEIDYKNNHDKTSVMYFSDVVTNDFAIINFICLMLGNGLNSPLYELVRERYGLVYHIEIGLEQLTNNSGIILINTLTDNVMNAQKIQVILNHILDNPKKYLTEERFNNQRRLVKIELAKENINRYANFEHLLNDKTWDIKNYIDRITMEDIYRIYNKYFKSFKQSIDKIEFNK